MITSMLPVLLRTKLQVWRRVMQPDGSGGQHTVWIQAGTEPARISQASAEERRVAQQYGARLTHRVHLRPDADVLRGDDLLDPSSGEAHRVLATLVPSVRVYLRADTELYQPEPYTQLLTGFGAGPFGLTAFGGGV